MDTIYTTELVALGASLAELAVKGTATAVSTKIKAIRDEKNTDKVRNTYDEIVSELLLERDEAIRIAQSYKSELEKVVISDEDIQHLHNTVSNILEIIKSIQIANALPKGEDEIAKVKSQVESYEQIKELIIAHAPGIGITFIFSSIHLLIISAPGITNSRCPCIRN